MIFALVGAGSVWHGETNSARYGSTGAGWAFGVASRAPTAPEFAPMTLAGVSQTVPAQGFVELSSSPTSGPLAGFCRLARMIHGAKEA